MMHEIVLHTITQAALILTTLSFLAPLPSCKQIWRNRCTGEMDVSPFLTGAIATFSWLRYGWVINDPVMIRINIIGFSAYTSYVIFFYLMSFSKRLLLRKIVLVVICMCLALYTIIASDDPTFWSGMMAIATSLTFITSPLASVSEVVKTQSTESLPFWIILFNFLVGSLWTLYGYLIDNYFLIFPNGLGTGLSVTQLCLFLIYPSTSSHSVKMERTQHGRARWSYLRDGLLCPPLAPTAVCSAGVATKIGMHFDDFLLKYKALLSRVKEFKAVPLSRFFEPFSLASGSGAYALVLKVTASGYSARSASQKIVHLFDPSTRGKTVEFLVSDHIGNILSGNILKITEVFAQETSNKQPTAIAKNNHLRYNGSILGSKKRFQIDHQSIISFHTFVTDYNGLFKERENLNILFTDLDLQIFFLLETYLAIKILNPLSIRSATSDFQTEDEIYKRRQNNNPYGYINMVGMVVKRKCLDKSVALTLWDGSPCDLKSAEPVVESVTSSNWVIGGEISFEPSETFSRRYTNTLKNYYVTVNIWNNDRPPDSEQYRIASEFCIDSYDVAVLLNVEKEIILPPEDALGCKSVSFTLRSGQHQGKALRVAKPYSVIGRLFYRIVKERIGDIMYFVDGVDMMHVTTLHEFPCIRIHPHQAEISLLSDFSISVEEQEHSKCDVTFVKNERQPSEDRELDTRQHSPSPGPSNASKRFRVSHSRSPPLIQLTDDESPQDQHSSLSCLPSRITPPMIFYPCAIESFLKSNLPPFYAFSSLISTSTIRLHLASQLFQGYKLTSIDLETYKNPNAIESLQQCFTLARVFRSILEFDPKPQAT